jgi:hypothetical protein
MKLHLHLGAHKTATTHFQSVLEHNRDIYNKNACYVSMEEFRANVTYAGKIMNPYCYSEVDSYLNKITKIKQHSLIVSEENIVGDIQHIYHSKALYGDLGKRLDRLSGFISQFSDVTIWFSIRSMDTFIPSMYCESLLHWRYRRFSRVFSGQYAHSWVPIILAIREALPGVKITVIPYESYAVVLPKWLEVMTGVKSGWNLMQADRPRSSFNSLAVKMLFYLNPFIPQSKTALIMGGMSDYFYGKGKGEKFMPLKKETKADLRMLYRNDLETIDNIGEGISLFKV